MHQRPGEAAGLAAGLVNELGGMAGRLSSLAAPAEEVFIEAGRVLESAVAAMRRVEAGFAELSDRLDGEDAHGAVRGIEQSVASIGGLANGMGGEVGCLGALAEDASRLAKRLQVLQGVAHEVSVLAINAKIQASQLTVGSADFMVFTNEMARLGQLAQSTIERAGVRVAELVAAIGRARANEENFARNSANELAIVRDRLAAGSATLSERRTRAVAAAQAVKGRSAEVAALVAGAIGDLQSNDITAQRIDHVRQALVTLAEMQNEENGGSLVGPVCRLQHAQLGRTCADYRDNVGRMVNHFAMLAGDMRTIVAEAESAFSDGSGGRVSFAGQMEADIRRANQLVDGLTAARARVQTVMAAVHSAVAQIVEDLRSVSSIDADMQVMGLNATLKCGRLGNQGRALAVIAHELRGCGKRTEDNARMVADLLAKITGAADSLRQMADDEGQKQLTSLAAGMSESLARLDALAVAMDGALGRLDSDGNAAAAALERLASGITIHHQVGGVLDEVCQRLEELGGQEGDAAEMDGVRERLRDMLANQYTMASERLIHQLVADDEAEPSQGGGAESAATNVDDFFF